MVIRGDWPGARDVGTLPRFGSDKLDASCVATAGSLMMLKLVRFRPVVPALVTVRVCVWLGPAPVLPGAIELKARSGLSNVALGWAMVGLSRMSFCPPSS